MVSIVVPVYNAGAYLRACLESLASQRYQDFEVLLVDDGSRDNSLAICQEWAAKDGRFRVIRQENAGVSVARNRALQAAKGDYVCFVDADDVVATDYLAHLLEMAGDGGFPVCGFTRDITMLGTGVGKTRSCDAKRFILDIVKGAINDANIWRMLFKRSIIEDNGIWFTPGCVRNEDTEFYIHYLLYEQQVNVSNYRAYYYRPNPSSAIGKPATKEALTSIEAAGRIDRLLFEKGLVAEDGIMLPGRVLAYAYSFSRQKNGELYAVLHE